MKLCVCGHPQGDHFRWQGGVLAPAPCQRERCECQEFHDSNPEPPRPPRDHYDGGYGRPTVCLLCGCVIDWQLWELHDQGHTRYPLEEVVDDTVHD